MSKRRPNLQEECELTAELVIFGDFETQQLLGILQPTHHKDQPEICSTSSGNASELKITIAKKNAYHARDLVDELYAVSARWDKVAALVEGSELDVLLYIKASFRRVAPAIMFTPEQLRWLADLNAIVDVDLYPLGS